LLGVPLVTTFTSIDGRDGPLSPLGSETTSHFRVASGYHAGEDLIDLIFPFPTVGVSVTASVAGKRHKTENATLE
jgi:hypothetical protein